MQSLRRAESLTFWAQTSLYLGVLFGGIAGFGVGVSSGNPVMMLAAGAVGAGIGGFSGYLAGLPLHALATILRDLDALSRDVDAVRRR